jgi:hypothetical protein
MDEIFVLRQIFQKTWEFDKEIHILFIDFRKAYDSIHRTFLIKIIREFNFPQKLIKLVEISIMETFIKVKVGSSQTEPILVKSGLRQGDSMLLVLFNIVLEKVIRAMKVRPDKGVKLQDSSIGLLAYADDLVLMEESPNVLKSLFDRLQRLAAKVGLQINETKTEYMVVGRRETAGAYPSLNVRNYVFNRAKQFKYLGSVITEKNSQGNISKDTCWQ